MSGARRDFTTASSLRRVFAGLAIASLALAAAAPAASSAARLAQHTPGTTEASHPHVYLMRGLLNIFSLGMDQLATEIASHGIDANVYNHTVADSVVAQIAAEYHAQGRQAGAGDLLAGSAFLEGIAHWQSRVDFHERQRRC